MRYEKREQRAALLGFLVSSTMLKKVLFGGLGFSCLFAPSALQAQIAVDPNASAAHRPDIVAAPNGVPSIDIVTPNSSGLSHNKYDDFNIGHSGVIWNNHAQEVGQSQLGGIMPGNPHLRVTGSAKVILNEVTSSKRSALNGPGEVFGRPADVIIANPNGITCDGCGFINTPHTTLTTGVPEIDASGFLKGFVIRGGDITFGVKGANFFTGKGAVDIVDIVSRTVHFEGPVAGKDIGVVAGTGSYDYSSRQMKELSDITGKPEYAIDGSALGALQADQIKLVATEKGVGVRMRHDMAANAGQLHLSADGKISLKNVFGHGGVVLKSKSQSVLAKHISSKKNIDIAAKKDVRLETIGAEGHLKIEAQDGLLTIAGQATSGGDMKLSSHHDIKVSGLGAGADMAFEAVGDLTIGGTVLAGGNLNAHAGGDIRAHFLAGGVDMTATGATGNLVLGSQGGVDLQSVSGGIAAENIYGAGDITLDSHKGILVSQSLRSHHDVALHTQPDAGVHFGQLIAYGRADIDGGAIDFSSLMTGGDAVLKGSSLEAGTVMTGLDFVASQASSSNPSGDLVFYDKGSLSITAEKGIKVGHIISGGNIEIFAGNDIYYDQVIGYGTATLTSVSGGISVENVLSVLGDVRLTAPTLDLSNNRSHIYTPQTLYLIADHIDVSGSKLTYGGLDFNSTHALDIHNARLQAVTDEGGTGDILFVAPGVMVDKATSVLAAREFIIKTGELHNSGQLAAGQNLVFSVTGNATINKTGLIYTGGNGALQVDEALLNDFGAIMAEGDLFFTNANGTGKSLSLVNKAGFIQAGGNLNIQTKTLQNEADSKPEIKEKKENATISFQKPKGSDQLRDKRLYHDMSCDSWGRGHHKFISIGHEGFIDAGFRFDEKLWTNTQGTYGTATLQNGTVYKAFTWKYDTKRENIERYQWNSGSYMSEKTVTQWFSHKPAVQGMIQSQGNLIINANDIKNNYSIIEAGRNADIHANVLTNVGATTYKSVYAGCHANTDAYCYAYNADGSHNAKLDITNNGNRHISSEVLDTVSGLVQAGGTLNLVVDQLNNTAVEGSITGDAHFEAKAVGDNPLEALNGLTGAGALFTPKVDINGTGDLSEGLPLPKPQSGGVGGTLPQQNFIYETRAEFLDVGKFYGSAYFLNRIGYQPDREIFFLGDAYFEKQLIEKQMRDLVGQGLGKGSFIPGKDSIEQVKTLLDRGADYAKAHNLPFGEPLSEEQLASLEAPMVIYVRQQVKGMEVYAPVLYIPEKDRASFVSAGALMMGDEVNMTTKDLVNSGRISASHNLFVQSGDIFSQGGHFAAENDAVLLAQNNIRLEAGRTMVDGVETVLNTNALSAGGNATVFAKQDITASGVKITTGSDLTMATEQGNLTIGAVKTEHHDAQGNASMHHQSEVHSGGSTTLSSGKDLNILGSEVQAKDNLFLQAKENVSIDATRNSANSHSGDQSSHVAVQNGSLINAGGDITAIAGQDGKPHNLTITGSFVTADGKVGLKASNDILINNAEESLLYERSYHKDGGVLSSSKPEYNKIDATEVVGSLIYGGTGVALESENDTQIVASTLTAGKIGETPDQKQADITIHSGGNLLIKGAQKHYDQQQQSSGNNALYKKSSKSSQSHSTTVSSTLEATGNIVLDAEKEATITASHITANEDIHVSGESVTIDGMTDHHKSHSETHETGFGVGSGKDFVSIYGSEGKTENEESFEHQGSSFNGKNITITAKKDDVNVVGSDFIAQEDIKLSAAHDINVLPGHNSYSTNSKEERTGFGFQFKYEKSSSSASLGIGVNGTKNASDEQKKTSVQSNFTVGRDVQINAGNDVNLQTTNVSAGRDVNIDAGNNITLSESYDTSNGKEKHENFFAGVTASADIGILGSIKNLKDAGKNFFDRNTEAKIGYGVLGALKGYDLYKTGKGLYRGIKGGATKNALLNAIGPSANVSVGFKLEKTEASSQVSTAVTDTIKAERSINMNAHKGSIHGVGADITAGTKKPIYALNSDEQSGNINLTAGQDITFESAKNTQSRQNNNENASMSIGYSYGTSGSGWTGSASFGKGKDSSEQVQHKNSHVKGSGTVHTNSGRNTTLAGAVISGDYVEMNVGGDFSITSQSDTEKTSSKKNSFSFGIQSSGNVNSTSIDASYQRDRSSSDYHSVVEQSGIKADKGGFDIKVKNQTTLTGGIIESAALADKNRLITGAITTSDITNSAHAQTKSDGMSISASVSMDLSKYGVGKNIAQNVLGYTKEGEAREGYTKSAISNSTIILTDEAGQKALTGQNADQAIASLNRDTANAHQGVSPIDVGKLKKNVQEDREMFTELLQEGFKRTDKIVEKRADDAAAKKRADDAAAKKRADDAAAKKRADDAAAKKRADAAAAKKRADAAAAKKRADAAAAKKRADAAAAKKRADAAAAKKRADAAAAKKRADAAAAKKRADAAAAKKRADDDAAKKRAAAAAAKKHADDDAAKKRADDDAAKKRADAAAAKKRADAAAAKKRADAAAAKKRAAAAAAKKRADAAAAKKRADDAAKTTFIKEKPLL
ncbi:hemagglutinin repeat-containing protein [Bartonella acomydis]|uniref:Filamentous haemagglutinin FhaB/tRNA nuclease CdiA-like TPS domain-containing protein n=1 Tax=Bartonella acomydis TaxID=686234 RepID=A0ABP9MK92_9HYPH